MRKFLSWILARAIIPYVLLQTDFSSASLRCRSFRSLGAEVVSWTNTSCADCVIHEANDSAADSTALPSIYQSNTTMILQGIAYEHDRISFEVLLTLAAGLVTAGTHVSMHYHTFDSSNHPSAATVEHMIYDMIPCRQRLYFRTMFTMIASVHAQSTGDVRSCHGGSSIFCKLRRLQTSATYLNTSMIMNGTENTLIVASVWDIMAITIAEHRQLPLLLVLSPTAEDPVARSLLPPDLSSANIRGWGADAVRCWWHNWMSIHDHTQLFLFWNRMRVNMNLPRLQHMTDVWKKSSVFLTTTTTTTPQQNSNERSSLLNMRDRKDSKMVVIQQPIVPPCIPCRVDALPVDYYEEPTVLLLMREHRRELWQGLELARASLEYHCKSRVCRYPTLRFVWVQQEEESLEDRLLPASAISEVSNVMDSFARHSPIAIFCSQCEHNYAWERFPVPYVFADSRKRPRDVAMLLLREIHNLERTEGEEVMFVDELSRMVDVIRRLGEKQNNTRVDGTDPRIQDKGLITTIIWSLAVYLAWAIVIIVSVLSLPLSRKYRNKAFGDEPQKYLGPTLGELWSRLHETDALFDLSVAWLKTQLEESRAPASHHVESRRRATNRNHASARRRTRRTSK